MHSPFVEQQPLIGLELQLPVARLQLSAVHASPSLQSASEAQHPVCATLLQVCADVSQVSSVQLFPSSQSPDVLQQSATGV
jgi:hypothetical protein